jgi:hypothetical protein
VACLNYHGGRRNFSKPIIREIKTYKQKRLIRWDDKICYQTVQRNFVLLCFRIGLCNRSSIDQSIDRSIAQHSLVACVFPSFGGLAADELPDKRKIRLGTRMCYVLTGTVSCWCLVVFAENNFLSSTLMCICSATVN